MKTLLLALAITLPQTHPHHITPKPDPTPTGPTVLIDTTLGRLTCKLFNETPNTTANFIALANGTKDWPDAFTKPVHNKPFYDALEFGGVSNGLVAGARFGGGIGLAGPPFPSEKSPISFDHSGLLVMKKSTPDDPNDKTALTSSSIFYVFAHSDAEHEDSGTIFGQCDEASIPTILALSHTLLTIDNHPAAPIAINHIFVLKPGDPTPPLSANADPASVTPQPSPMPIDPIPAPQPTGPTATIDTTMGTLTCKLFNETPIATANFIGLVNGTKDWHLPSTKALQHNRRFYDGLSFGRVIPDFMIQNSDLPSDPGGDGDIGYNFPVEPIPGLTFDRPGRLAYANAGPNTNQSEFFVTEHPVHRLDTNYTIFGQCDEASVKLVEAIARVPRDQHNKPLKSVTIRHITITESTH
jgi:cyclophilin family peptidyl-prolyl cis-trans isomerase